MDINIFDVRTVYKLFENTKYFVRFKRGAQHAARLLVYLM